PNQIDVYLRKTIVFPGRVWNSYDVTCKKVMHFSVTEAALGLPIECTGKGIIAQTFNSAKEAQQQSDHLQALKERLAPLKIKVTERIEEAERLQGAEKQVDELSPTTDESDTDEEELENPIRRLKKRILLEKSPDGGELPTSTTLPYYTVPEPTELPTSTVPELTEQELTEPTEPELNAGREAEGDITRVEELMDICNDISTDNWYSAIAGGSNSVAIESSASVETTGSNSAEIGRDSLVSNDSKPQTFLDYDKILIDLADVLETTVRSPETVTNDETAKRVELDASTSPEAPNTFPETDNANWNELMKEYISPQPLEKYDFFDSDSTDSFDDDSSDDSDYA
ncbi:hypothetical protein LCGC14_2274600, partial [marine sediment metagenome]